MDDARERFYTGLKTYAYYIVVFVVSVIATAFLPFIGSEVDAGFQPPTTWQERIIFLCTRLVTGLINVIIFYCFIAQAEVNVKDNEKYMEANRLLEKVTKNKEKIPRSPLKFKTIQWLTKGVTLFLSSVCATIALYGIILHFDLTQLLVYAAVVILGIVFGYLTMRKNEYYWIHEYYDYAKRKYEEQEEIEDSKTDVGIQCEQ